MRPLRGLPHRRKELLAGFLLAMICLGSAGFLHAQHADETASALLMVTLEIIAPLNIGLVSAGLLSGDPALDLLLCAHRPAWQTLLVRLLLVGMVGVILSCIALSLASLWGLLLPIDGSDRLYIGLSPLVFYMGLSSAAALLRGRMLDGVLASLGFMGVSLTLLPLIPQLCAAGGPGEPCPGWLASPMMTLGNPMDAYWPLNRLVWLLLGLVLLGLSLRLARREEALLQAVSTE
jgi:hypothetical protein